jgi:hypothetical protein
VTREEYGTATKDWKERGCYLAFSEPWTDIWKDFNAKTSTTGAIARDQSMGIVSASEPRNKSDS